MKKLSTLFILITAFGISGMCQQETSQLSPVEYKDSVYNTKTQTFVIQPLPFFVGGFEVGYGTAIGKSNRMVKFLAGYYYSEDPSSYESVGGSKMEGYRFEFQYLLSKPIRHGDRYYVGGYLTYKAISMDVSQTNFFNPVPKRHVTGSASGLGVIFGFQSLVFDNFYFDIYFGGGPNFALNSSNQDVVHLDVVNPYKRSINPRAGLSFGLLF